MKKNIIYLVAALSLAGIASFEACKKKTEATPVADFSISAASANEGDTLVLTNKSTNGKTYLWTFSGSSWSSTDANTVFYPDSAGTFSLSLKATNGDGKSATKTMSVTVLADTVWRLSGNSKKVWWLKSIIYSGTEQLTATCQKDDEFVVFKTKSTATDTCQLTEGTDKCPSGTYLFQLPASSNWRLKGGAFQFALSVFGSPINLSFAISKCTNREFEGTDAVNNVTIKLARK